MTKCKVCGKLVEQQKGTEPKQYHDDCLRSLMAGSQGLLDAARFTVKESDDPGSVYTLKQAIAVVCGE